MDICLDIVVLDSILKLNMSVLNKYVKYDHLSSEGWWLLLRFLSPPGMWASLQ